MDYTTRAKVPQLRHFSWSQLRRYWTVSSQSWLKMTAVKAITYLITKHPDVSRHVYPWSNGRPCPALRNSSDTVPLSATRIPTKPISEFKNTSCKGKVWFWIQIWRSLSGVKPILSCWSELKSIGKIMGIAFQYMGRHAVPIDEYASSQYFDV